MPKSYFLYISLVLVCCYVKPDWIKTGISIDPDQLKWKDHKYRVLTNVPSQLNHHHIQACYFHDRYIVLPDLIQNHCIWFFLRSGQYSHFVRYPVKRPKAFAWRPEIPGVWIADSLSNRWQLRDIEGELVEEGKLNCDFFGIQQSNPVIQQSGKFYVSTDNRLIQVLPDGEERIVITGYSDRVLENSILSPEWILIPDEDSTLHIFGNESKKIYVMKLRSSEVKYHFNDLIPNFSQDNSWFSIIGSEDFRSLKNKNSGRQFDHLPDDILQNQLLLVERNL